jgi:RNA polymerase sigma factor (sigma-70 family)
MNEPDGGPDIPPEVIETLMAKLITHAAARLPTMVDAIEFGKDLAQQALIKASHWYGKNQNKTMADFERMARHCLKQLLIDHVYRQLKNMQTTQSIQAIEQDAGVDSLESLTTDEPLPDEILNRADWASLVNQALAKMSNPAHRKVLKLRHWHEMDNEQIAQALGICTRTVIRRYQEAENAFRTKLRSLTDDINY